MNPFDEAVSYFRRLQAKEKVSFEPARVIQVDTLARTCEVEILRTGISVDGIRIQASSGNSDGVAIVPSEGSNVIVGLLNEDVSGFVVATDAVDTLEISAKSPIKIQVGTTSLKSILDSLIDELLKLRVITAVGPGTIDPSHAAPLGLIKTNVAKILA